MVQFRERAVAYIDVLGFSGLVRRAASDPAALSELNRLVALLGAVIPYLDAGVAKTVPRNLMPEHVYISDCIILSAPLQVQFTEMRNYSGLEIVVMRAIQVTHALLDAGYLVRGGIDVGPLWHTRANVVWPAYQEAYLLETNADHPRILLSARATPLWKSGGLTSQSRMCIDYQNAFMVNGLHDYYIPQRFTTIDAAFSHYEAIATHNLGLGLKPGVLQKWIWMRQYIADERAISCL